MATLQKSFKYDGNPSSSALTTINLNFEVPTFEFVTTLIDGKPFVERSPLGKQVIVLNKKLTETSYETTFRNEYLVGNSNASIINFLNYLAHIGFRSNETGLLDSLSIEIGVVRSDETKNLTGQSSMKALCCLSTASEKYREITEQQAALNSSASFNADAADELRLKLADYARENMCIINKNVFADAAEQFKTIAPLNDYAFLFIIAHVIDLSSGKPKIKINTDEIKTFLKTHFGIDKAEAVKAILRLIKDDLLDFPVLVPEIKAVEIKGTFKILTSGNPVAMNDFSFYTLAVEYSIQAPGNPAHLLSATFDWKTIQASQLSNNTVPFSFPPVITNLINSSVSLRVSGYDGSEVWRKEYAVNNPDLQNLKIEVALSKPVVLSPADEPIAATGNKKLTGKIVEMSDNCKINDVTVVVQAKQSGDTIWKIVGAATTDASGNFSLPYPYGNYVSAQALVSLTPDTPADIPVYTDQQHISIKETIADDFLFLLVKGADCKSMDKEPTDCDCQDVKKSNRLPDQEELIKSDSYTQDIGGSCVNLSTPNRTLNEYSYTAVVRTSDPDVANYILTKDEKGNFSLQGGLTKIDRSPVDLSNPIYWQDAPDDHNSLSLYQAVKVATGHILHYSVVTKADGYSMGELLYSLPLAPGQKKEIVVLDQLHTLNGSETQRIAQRESLAASLVNDVDIADTIAGNIGENVTGGSSATTAGVSGGFGLGAIIDAVGLSLGVAGGVANAHSNASQNSSRILAEYFHEHMKNSITQNAQSYREMNASVITTVQEDQRYGVTSEVIANHNHCHSLTMMYYEVLKHYAIYQELSYVEECLFVPLLMTDFIRENVYKWRDVLAKHLLPMPSETYLQPFTIIKSGRQHPLLRGFDAIERIKTLYANVDFPIAAYDDEIVNFITGEMYIQTNLPRPKTKYDRIQSWPLEKKSNWSWSGALIGGVLAGPLGFIAGGYLNADGGIKPDAQAVIDDYMSVDANFASVPPAHCIRIKKIDIYFFEDGGFDKAQWMAYGKLFGKNSINEVVEWLSYYFKDRLISEWDSIFYNDIAPALFERIVSHISLGNFSAIDFATEKKYKGGQALMRLNLRGTGSNKKRNQITELNILFNNYANLSNDLITLNVKNLIVRYSTSHYNGVLYSGFVNNDLYDNIAHIATPENANEKRNPRKEDQYLAQKLIEHLNSNLEYYNKWLWKELDKDRLYMLLDGFNIETYNDFGIPIGARSLASVVKNELIGISGNSLIMPVAPGYKIDRTYIVEQPIEGPAQEINLLDHYKPLTPIPPYRISIPSKGVFAEAVQGACDACEKVQENTSQDWDKFKTDEPTGISPVTVPVPTVTDWKAAFKELATPIVNIQNAPAAPTPGAGLAASGVADLLGKSDIFKDVTGLDQNQKNAMQTYLSNQENAKAFAEMAKEMAMQGHNTEHSDKIADAIRNAPELSQEEKAQLLKDHFGQMVDGGQTKKTEQEAAQNTKPSLTDAAVKAADEGKPVKASSTDGSGKSETVDIGAASPGATVLAEVTEPIPGLKQITTNVCWATAATIMMSWKKGKTLTVEEALALVGSEYLQKYNDNEPLPASEKEPFIAKLNMVGEAPASYTIQSYVDWVNSFGPVWITTDSADAESKFSPHARILVKITGTGSADGVGTDFTFINPATGGLETEHYNDFLKAYEQMVTDNPGDLFIQIVHFKDKKTAVGEGSSAGATTWKRKAPDPVWRANNIAKEALAKLNYFKSIPSSPAWILNKAAVYARLDDLVRDPWKLNQGFIGYCGPAAFFMTWIDVEPEAFVDFAISLYETGKSNIGDKIIIANNTLLQTDITAINSHCPVGIPNIPIVDWMIMSSLEKTTVNITTGAIDGGDTSGTWPSDMIAYLTATNLYYGIHEEDEWGASDKDTVNEKVNRDGDKSELMLCVDADIVNHHDLGYFPTTNHFVALTSGFYQVSGDDLDYFDCWCWGKNNVKLGVTWYEFVAHVGPFIYTTRKDAYWYQLAGEASEIVIGQNNDRYVLGKDLIDGAHQIFKWEDYTWKVIAGSTAKKIAVLSNGDLIAIDKENNIVRYNGGWSSFSPVLPTASGKATELTTGKNGSIYALGDVAVDGDFPIFMLNGTGWDQLPDGGTKIAVDLSDTAEPNGVPYLLKSKKGVSSNIFKFSNGIWSELPSNGEAHEIAIGKNGAIWIIGKTAASGGFGIHRWNGAKWEKTRDGAGTKIAVDPNGVPYTINSLNKIYQRKPVFPNTKI